MSKFLISYSKLLALRENIPETYQVEEYWVEQFHHNLSQMSELFTSEVTDEFMVEASEVKQREEGGNYLTGVTNYSSEKYCLRSVLIAKIDGFLKYMKISAPAEDATKIGFTS